MQINEQIYLVFQVIKQVDKKVEIYYKQILKLANSLQHKANDTILTTFFKTIYYLISTLLLQEWNMTFATTQGSGSHCETSIWGCTKRPRGTTNFKNQKAYQRKKK